MGKEEIDKWLDEEYGCSYTRLEELHDFYFGKYCDLKEENQQLKSKLELYENGVYYSSEMNKLRQEIEELKKQLDYVKSGEYFNQLRFERDMLQDLVDNEKVSEEDKQFIDMTHRNTELLEENETLKIRLNKKKESLRKYLILEVQKKEFMDYLEKERNIYENDIQNFSKDYKPYYLLINELKISKKKIEEILSKYKEIIGSVEMPLTPKEILEEMYQDSQDWSIYKPRYIYTENGKELVVPKLDEELRKSMEKTIKETITKEKTK